ncbi:hypothetical protein NDU88_001875 [Pleurodeles waltl]|uniref:Uncharacterized protein n=1 Tax=Pleurodeles waltl TaxID=8319 RepID=A0AAV7W0Q7_PLEWA|nr:hypothetical protein NDU88_001875 [Pleurodeles waltl]
MIEQSLQDDSVGPAEMVLLVAMRSVQTATREGISETGLTATWDMSQKGAIAPEEHKKLKDRVQEVIQEMASMCPYVDEQQQQIEELRKEVIQRRARADDSKG